MGVMKRIYTERQWNDGLAGAATSTEIAAMKRLWKRSEAERKRKTNGDRPQKRLFE